MQKLNNLRIFKLEGMPVIHDLTAQTCTECHVPVHAQKFYFVFC